jgi:uncharacterized protein (TIGR00251 family)
VTRITVHAKPRAKVSRIVRVTGLTVEVAIAAVPADGAANVELIAVLAKALGVPKRDLSLVRGTASKHKAVEVAGLTEAEVADRLAR